MTAWRMGLQPSEGYDVLRRSIARQCAAASSRQLRVRDPRQGLRYAGYAGAHVTAGRNAPVGPCCMVLLPGGMVSQESMGGPPFLARR
jgi:hypothetical protein